MTRSRRMLHRYGVWKRVWRVVLLLVVLAKTLFWSGLEIEKFDSMNVKSSKIIGDLKREDREREREKPEK